MSVGWEMLDLINRSKYNYEYENTEKKLISWIYKTCTEQCLESSTKNQLDSKEKNCLSWCYDASI